MKKEDVGKTKKQIVTEALLANDVKKALRVARTFKRDFTTEEQSVITRAAEFHRSTLYSELGYDYDDLLKKATFLLRRKYLGVE